MAEIYFYHLERQPLDSVLPVLLERSLARGWRVLLRLATPERQAALDDHLWTYADGSFLPHGPDGESGAEEHPVLLTLGDRNANGAKALFLAEGAAVPDDLSGYERVAYLLDGGDEAAVAAGRAAFRALKQAGHDLSYWQQDDEGRWGKRG